MTNFIRNYVERIQDLRVRAGLTRVSNRALALEILKYFLTFQLASLAILTTVGYLNLIDVNSVYIYLTPIHTLIALLTPHIRYWVLVRRRRRFVEDELSYFIVSEAVTYTGTTELISDLCEVSRWGDVFPSLSAEGLRLSIYRKFLTTFEAVSMYVKYIPSNAVSRLLSDYILALSRGLLSEWFTHTSTELIRKLRNSAKVLTQLRTTISLIFGVLIGYFPPLILALSTITGDGGLTLITLTTPLLTILTLLLLPQHPLHLRIYHEGGFSSKISYAVYALLTSVVMIPSLTHVPSGFSIQELLLISATALIVNGVLRLHNFIEAIREVYELPRIITFFSETPQLIINPLNALRDVLKTSRVRSLRGLSDKLNLNNMRGCVGYLRTWLGKYVFYVIFKSIVNGSLGKEQLLNLRLLTLDMLEDFKLHLVSSLPLAMLAILMPWLLVSMIHLSGVNFELFLFYILTVVVSYSTYVEYVLFSNINNTLVLGVSLLILATLRWV